jgi:hypothetical protein
MVSYNFSLAYILLIALWPRGRLSLWQKLVPGVFPGGKWGRCVRLTTSPPFCAVVKKSGNLNFLEPSGPLQACNETALTFFYIARELVSVISRTRKSFTASKQTYVTRITQSLYWCTPLYKNITAVHSSIFNHFVEGAYLGKSIKRYDLQLTLDQILERSIGRAFVGK